MNRLLCVRYVEDGLETMAQKTMHNKLPMLCQKVFTLLPFSRPSMLRLKRRWAQANKQAFTHQVTRIPLFFLQAQPLKFLSLPKKPGQKLASDSMLVIIAGLCFWRLLHVKELGMFILTIPTCETQRRDRKMAK